MKKKKPSKIVSPPTDLNINDMFKEITKRNINDYYYDAMELLGCGKKENKEALRLLKMALKMDEDYVQTYIGLVGAYYFVGDEEKRKEAIKTAFEKTVKKFPKWPKRMLWGWLENRAYLRAIQYMGDLHWENGKNEKAIELYRLLLKLNPNDNQGVRYEIAAVYAGLTGEDVNRMTQEGNEKQDWSEQENLVSEQNKKHKFWKKPKY